MKTYLLAVAISIAQFGISQEGDSTKQENEFADYPARELTVSFMNPLNFDVLDRMRTVNLDVGYNVHRKRRHYLTHNIILQRKASSGNFWQNESAAALYEFSSMYRYNMFKKDWLHTELSFGVMAGYHQHAAGAFQNTTPVLGPTFKAKLIFDIGEWGGITIASNTRLGLGFKDYYIPTEGTNWTGPGIFNLSDYLRVGVNFYLGPRQKKEKKK